jgi:PAS domain S-box-containing protein
MQDKFTNDPVPPAILYGDDASRLGRLAAIIPGMLYDYVLLPNGSSKFLYVGSKCREILEVDQPDLIADANRFWELVIPEDMQRLKSEDLAANREGKSFSAEVRIQTRSGCLKWIQLSSRPNPVPLDEIVVWSGFMLDITERKQQEELIKQHYTLLIRQKADLEATLGRIKRLEGLLSICMQCKKIRTESNDWHQLERYLREHSDAVFSHGICPECLEKEMKKLD